MHYLLLSSLTIKARYSLHAGLIKGQISLIEIYKIIRPNLALISPINSLA
jgi:hypothetical protein